MELLENITLQKSEDLLSTCERASLTLRVPSAVEASSWLVILGPH